MAQVAPHRPPSIHTHTSASSADGGRGLPDGKTHHYFLSHKKTHTVWGGVPEHIAKNFHDSLELLGFKGWFDIDNLKRINEGELRAAIGQCCSVIILLHEETVDSTWCSFEWQCAREAGVPCKVVVDMERASKSQLLAKCTTSHPNLLDYQWLEFTDRHRRDCLRELIDFLENDRIGGSAEALHGGPGGASGSAAQEEESTLRFGHGKMEVVPPFLKRLLNLSGNPLRPPKSLRGRAYVLLLHFLRLFCLVLCLVRFVYARGPSVSERHSCMIMVLAHILWFIQPPVLNSIIFSDVFRHMLRDMEGTSGEETARRLSYELKKAAAPAIMQIPAAFVVVNLAFVPSFLDPFHTGPDAAIGDKFFGYFSASVWTIALLGIVTGQASVPPLMQLIYEVDLHQFAAAFDVLDPSLAQLGLTNHVRGAVKSLRRRRYADTASSDTISSSTTPNNGGSAADSSSQQPLAASTQRLRVTPERLARFHERWVLACRNHEEIMARKARIDLCVWLVTICAWFLPLTQVAVANLRWLDFNWSQHLRLVLVTFVGLGCWLESVMMCADMSGRLAALVADSRSLVCEDPSTRIYLNSVCADAPTFRTIIPCTWRVFGALLAIHALSYVPYAFADWENGSSTFAIG